MPQLVKLPEPPRHRIVNEDGVLTEQARRWFDTLYKKMGGPGEIPSESLSSKAILNISNNAVVDWQDVNASSGLLRVYGPGGVGSGWNRFEGTADGFRTLGPFAAATFSKPYNARYYVSYDPMTTLYLVTTDYRETLRDGLFWAGQAKASISFGGGGSTTGGGGAADGGQGGSSDDGDGFGVLL